MSKLRHSSPALAAAALLMAACSCSTLKGWIGTEPPPPPEPPKPATTMVQFTPLPPRTPGLEQADKLLDNILEGVKLKEYKRYSRNFSDSLKLASPESTFQEECIRRAETDGDYVSRQFLGSLNKGARRHYMWKARFSKNGDDLLIRMVVEGGDGNERVASLNIR